MHTPAEASSTVPHHHFSLSELKLKSSGQEPRLSLATIIGLSLLLVFVLPTTTTAQEAPTIQWELVNPFRFIHDQKTIDELKDVYATLPKDNKTAFSLERQLQKASDVSITRQRQDAKSCDHPTAEQKHQCFAPYAGWFAKVAENYHAKTCWDSQNHAYRKDGPCADYIYPKSHRVRVFIANPETFGDAQPQWTVHPALGVMPCDVKYGKRFCIEFDVPYHADGPQKIEVNAQFPTLTLTTDPSIQVRDLLVVGLGDSYAAGEGNPDIPAMFIDSDLKSGRHRSRIAAWLAGHGATYYPRKDKAIQAEWLDRRCHRSMYSYQFKTALQLALSNPHAAITYVTFSCSGAITDDIISKNQRPNEDKPELNPQLQELGRVLQSDTNLPRQIDYLLLSTGGNDIGFANYVAYILLRDKLLLEGLRIRSHVSEDIMKKNFENNQFEKDLLSDTKPGNYVRLQKALLDPGTPNKPNVIKLKDCEAGKPCERVVLTPYPNALTDETGHQCTANRLEFDESFGTDQKRESKLKTVKQYVFDQINTVQRQVHDRLGWTVIDGNVGLYINHGFCARDSQSTSNGEKFQIPTWLNNKWTSFDPRDYRAYESRFRWFRLPVDSKLTTDQAHVVFGQTISFALEDVRSNIMHPTAEALAKTADLNVEAIRNLEKPRP